MSIDLIPSPGRHIASTEAPALPDTGVPPVSAGRRALDIVAASVGLVVSSPLLLTAGLCVLVSDGRPLLFRQVRLGEGARPFTMIKLRTMRVASRDGAATEAGVTTGSDHRVTRLGRVLRRLSIDELPQLWHVLRGQMTLVGPRPESAALAAHYPEHLRFVLDARPGLTGPAQLMFRESSACPPPTWPSVEAWYLEVLVPRRVEADLAYLARPTLVATLRYLALTALFIVGLKDLRQHVADPRACAHRADRVVPATDARAAGRGWGQRVDETVSLAPATTIPSQRAFTHSPVLRSNSKL